MLVGVVAYRGPRFHLLYFPTLKQRKALNPYRCSSESGESCYLDSPTVSTPISPKYTPEPKHTGNDLDLGNAVGVTEDDANLRGGSALLGELADLLDDLLGGGLEPGGRGARVGDGGGRDALALAVKTAHFD